jgi:hypothetical protein
MYVYGPVSFFFVVGCMGGGGITARAHIYKPFQEPRNRFPAWWAGKTTLFDVPARQATQAGGIDSWAP